MIDKIKSYKLVILGDGATALVSQTYDPTIENLYRKHILINGESCILEILDTAGQEEYVALRHQWIKDGDGFLLVYSVSSRSTFDRIKRFKEQIIEIKNTKSVPLVLVGNKSDRIFDREIPFEEGQSLANLFNCEFIETSAKSFTNKMIKDYTSISLDPEARNYNIYGESYTGELDVENSYIQKTQKNLVAYVNNLKREIANKDRDKEELFSDYENLQEKYNNLLSSYESLQISSSRQLTVLRTKLSSLISEMDKNMDHAHEELEIKTLHLDRMKQKLEKFRNANRMANEHIRNLQMNFNLERNRWKEEKIRLCSNKYSAKRIEALEELILLHKQYENLRFEVPDTKENSVCTTSSSLNSFKHEEEMSNDFFDNSLPNRSLAIEMDLCFNTDQKSDIEDLQLIDPIDRSNLCDFSKTINHQDQENKPIMVLKEDFAIPTSKDAIHLSTDMTISAIKYIEGTNHDLYLSTRSIQTEEIFKNTTTLNTVQTSMTNPLDLQDIDLLKYKKSNKDILEDQKSYLSTTIHLSKYQSSKICPPLPIPIRNASLIFKKIPTVPHNVAKIISNTFEKRGHRFNCFNTLHVMSNVFYQSDLHKLQKKRSW
ncbi:hypothetical protein PCK1_003098 [Pneumocystis canis]|nr:hypothetical protein PCK1_003098 [Pneumocystis canis]